MRGFERGETGDKMKEDNKEKIKAFESRMRLDRG